jgi:hypothetical protein
MAWDERSGNPFELFTVAQYGTLHKWAIANIAAKDEEEVQGGILLGCVDLIDCQQELYGEPWDIWSDRDKGLWYWKLSDPMALKKPIPMKGGRKIFKREIPDEVDLWPRDKAPTILLR